MDLAITGRVNAFRSFKNAIISEINEFNGNGNNSVILKVIPTIGEPSPPLSFHYQIGLQKIRGALFFFLAAFLKRECGKVNAEIFVELLNFGTGFWVVSVTQNFPNV